MTSAADATATLSSSARARGLVLVALVAIASALVGVVFLIAGARWAMPPVLSGSIGDAGWTARSHGWFVPGGFYDPEIDPDTLHQFSWTGTTARLSFPELDRSQAYRLTLGVSAPRPQGTAAPVLGVLVDGIVRVTEQTSSAPQAMSCEVPPHKGTGAVVTLVSSDVFVPGSSGDDRSLGVIVHDVSLVPASGHFGLTWHVMAQAALAILLVVAGVLVCGLRSWVAVVAGAAVSMAYAWLLLQDGAFIGTYATRLVHIGVGVALIGLAVAGARAVSPVVADLPEWPVAIGLVLCASAVKLAFFAHPLATVGDAIFQVHRAQRVHAGGYFFTSITPRPFFEFPYAIALYVAAQPFWEFFRSPFDLARLLRGLSLAADALVGVALYAAARRQWKSRVTALLCATLWPFARAPLEALCNANLTNVFGQGFFGAAMGTIAWTAAGNRISFWALVAATGLALVAFLSHFSTVSVGIPILCATAIAFVAAGRGHVRRLGVWVLIAMLAAATVSYAVYYSHFTSVYRDTLTRVFSHHVEPATGSSIAASPATKLVRWLTQGSDDYGLSGVALAGAIAGAVLLVRRRRGEALTLVLAAWALVWIGFAALGVLSPIQMRANLAVAPVFVCLCAYLLGRVAVESRLGAAVAATGVVVLLWDGFRLWLTCLGR